MRRLLVALLATVCVVLPVQAAGAREASRTIRLVSVATGLQVRVDKPPTQELSRGDVVRITSVLRNEVAQFGRPKGAAVGRDVGTLTIVSATRADVAGTATLPGGTIRFAGRSTVSSPRETIAVIGGTGTFAGARGTLEVTSLGTGGTRARNVYRLRLP
jgi:hypothetical protein